MTRTSVGETAAEIAYGKACEAITGALHAATAQVEHELNEHNLRWASDAAEIVGRLASALAELRGSEVVEPGVKSSFTASE